MRSETLIITIGMGRSSRAPLNWLRAFGDDHLGPECDQLGRKLRVTFGAAPGRTNVKGEVAALDPSVFPQRSDEGLPSRSLSRVRDRHGPKSSDVSDRRLCGRGRWEGTKKQDGDREETHAHRSTPILVLTPREIDKIYAE